MKIKSDFIFDSENFVIGEGSSLSILENNKNLGLQIKEKMLKKQFNI